MAGGKAGAVKGSIKLAGQPSGAVALSIAYNAETDACVLLQVTNESGEKLDILLSLLQVEKLADLATDASMEATGRMA